MSIPKRSVLIVLTVAIAAAVAVLLTRPTAAEAQGIGCVGNATGSIDRVPPEGALIGITAEGDFEVVCELPVPPEVCRVVRPINAAATFRIIGPMVVIQGSVEGTIVIFCGPEDDDDDLEPPVVSTEGCHVTYGGRITPFGGEKATFGGNARATSTTVEGQEQYQDHPVLTFHSLNVLALVCPTDEPGRASIFGQGEVNGAGPVRYRIDLRDAGEPGTADTYWIRLDGGYDSGEQVLEGGNVQFHEPAEG